MIPFSIIVAMDQNRGIGKAGQLPWHLPADLKHFKEISCRSTDPTKPNVVIMGRKTWESLPSKFRPLPGRINVVLSRNKDLSLPEGVLKAASLPGVFDLLASQPLDFQEVFVIGGEKVFTEALKLPACQKIYLTEIFKSFNCDTFIPPFTDEYQKVFLSDPLTESDLSFRFSEFTRKSFL